MLAKSPKHMAVYLLVLSCTFVGKLMAEDFVIIEKPTEKVEYKMDDEFEENQGAPVVKRSGRYFSISYMKKEFTNVETATNNVASTFMGVEYGYEYNMSWISVSAGAGVFVGNKDEALADEASYDIFKSALKNQVVIDLGANLYFNLLENYYVRPYIGGGAYVNQYKYPESVSATKNTDYKINSSFLRAGFMLLISKMDTASATNLWREFGVYRVSLILEGKKYAPVDPSNTSKAEMYSGLLFEY